MRRRAGSLPTRRNRFTKPRPYFANHGTRRRSASCRTGRRLFPPRPAGLRHKGQPQTTHLTVNGRLAVRRTVYWSPQNGTVIPVDQWLGLTEQRFSPGVRERCCRVAFHDPDKTHGPVVGTAGDPAAAGRLMRREARRLHLAQAKVQ